MINRLLPFFLVFASFSMIACESTNPFDTGPAYDAEANLKIDSAKIVAFLDTAQIDSLYRIHDPSGVVIIVQEEGVGTRPTTGTVIYTNYTGKLLDDGSIFDTTLEDVAKQTDFFDEDRNYQPFAFNFRIDRVIAGWDIAFARLRPGSKAVLVIPSTWGYQDDENRPLIPPNSVLIFEIDFLGID